MMLNIIQPSIHSFKAYSLVSLDMFDIFKACKDVIYFFILVCENNAKYGYCFPIQCEITKTLLPLAPGMTRVRNLLSNFFHNLRIQKEYLSLATMVFSLQISYIMLWVCPLQQHPNFQPNTKFWVPLFFLRFQWLYLCPKFIRSLMTQIPSKVMISHVYKEHFICSSFGIYGSHSIEFIRVWEIISLPRHPQDLYPMVCYENYRHASCIVDLTLPFPSFFYFHLEA